MAGRGRLRVLLRPRWLVAHVVILVAAVAFINLGFWQLRRLHHRIASNGLQEARMAAEPLTLPSLLASVGLDLDASGASMAALDYRRVIARGRFDPASEVLLRFRSHAGEAGFDVLTPLRLASGKAVLVDRGWVPYRLDVPPVAEAAPPSGEVTVEGLFRVPQRAPTRGLTLLAPRDPPDGPLQRPYYADPRRLAAQMAYPLVDATITMLEQTPPQSGPLPVPATEPVLDNGPHLGYAIQWFSFATIVLVGYAFLLRHTVRDAAKRGRDRT